MAQTSIPYAVARTRVLETRLISQERLRRMLDAPDVQSISRTLSEAGYGGGDSADYEEMIGSELARAYAYVREVSTNQLATDVFMLRYDCHNIKVLFKSMMLGRDMQALLSSCGTIAGDATMAAIEGEDYSRLPGYMAAAAREIRVRLDSRDVSAQWLETRMDIACYADMADYARRSKDGLVIGCVAVQADLLNLRTMLRLKGLDMTEQLASCLLPGGRIETSRFIDALGQPEDQLYRYLDLSRYELIRPGLDEYLKSRSLSLLERLADDAVMHLVRGYRYDSFTLAPVIGYIIAKEREAQAVRLVMVSRANNVPQELVTERLRELYE